MLNKQVISILLFTMLIAIGCASPNSLTSDELTNVSGVLVADQTYDRVEGAEIHFEEEDKTVKTDSNGVFMLYEMGVGNHTVTISADGYETAEKEVEIVNGGTRLELTIE